MLEGLPETLTITRLGRPDVLLTSLKSTNIIKFAFDGARSAARNVKRWQSGEQVHATQIPRGLGQPPSFFLLVKASRTSSLGVEI